MFQLASQSVFQLAPPSIGKIVCQQPLDQNSEESNIVFYL